MHPFEKWAERRIKAARWAPSIRKEDMSLETRCEDAGSLIQRVSDGCCLIQEAHSSPVGWRLLEYMPAWGGAWVVRGSKLQWPIIILWRISKASWIFYQGLKWALGCLFRGGNRRLGRKKMGDEEVKRGEGQRYAGEVTTEYAWYEEQEKK